MKKHTGFSLIEMMVVLAVIAILSVMIIPTNTAKIEQKQVKKALKMVEYYKDGIAASFLLTQKFPADNTSAGMPAADKLISPYTTSLEMQDGAFHITLGNDVTQTLQGKVISIRPLVVEDSPMSPISWACGHKPAPEGMLPVGENRTDIERISLPLSCR
jgi:type IV pilus assembly protein PilA